MDLDKKRTDEKNIIRFMIQSYCHRNHHEKQLCPQCQELLDYANKRIDSCPFMATKTFCSSCHIHCYAPDKRKQIKAVMKSSGPSMLFHHPLLLIKHMMTSKRRSK